MNKRSVITIIVVVILLIIFFFPKESFSWGSATGLTKSCKCLGFEINLFPGIEGSTSVTCFGIPYSCEQNP